MSAIFHPDILGSEKQQSIFVAHQAMCNHTHEISRFWFLFMETYMPESTVQISKMVFLEVEKWLLFEIRIRRRKMDEKTACRIL